MFVENWIQAAHKNHFANITKSEKNRKWNMKIPFIFIGMYYDEATENVLNSFWTHFYIFTFSHFKPLLNLPSVYLYTLKRCSTIFAEWMSANYESLRNENNTIQNTWYAVTLPFLFSLLTLNFILWFVYIMDLNINVR